MAEADAASSGAPRPKRVMRGFRRRRSTVVTVGVLGVLLLLVLLAFFAFGKDSPTDSSLLLVAVVFRHGERTPTQTYPNDPHHTSVWTDGMGQLTNKGKLQMFRLGETLQQRYGSLVGAIYSPDLLRASSSSHDRCLMSAEALLAGLMPPAPAQMWHPDLNWQPIPVHSVPRSQDALIAAKKICPRYDQELKEAYNSPEIKEIDSKNKELYKFLTKHAGHDINNVTAVESLYDILKIEQMNNLKLPDWVKTVFPDKMHDLALQSKALFTHTDFMKRMKGGPLLKDIVEYMQEKRKHPNLRTRKLHLYASHDMTIVNLWRTLGFTQLLDVDYGASLMFELRSIDQGAGLGVQVLYLNSSSSLVPQVLKVPGCSEPCKLESFVSSVQSFLPTSWEKECKS